MSDKELNIFEEAARLHESGHAEEEIAVRMAPEKWKQYQQASVHFKEECERAMHGKNTAKIQ
jgi:hypothetical protein